MLRFDVAVVVNNASFVLPIWIAPVWAINPHFEVGSIRFVESKRALVAVKHRIVVPNSKEALPVIAMIPLQVKHEVVPNSWTHFCELEHTPPILVFLASRLNHRTVNQIIPCVSNRPGVNNDVDCDWRTITLRARCWSSMPLAGTVSVFVNCQSSGMKTLTPSQRSKPVFGRSS